MAPCRFCPSSGTLRPIQNSAEASAVAAKNASSGSVSPARRASGTSWRGPPSGGRPGCSTMQDRVGAGGLRPPEPGAGASGPSESRSIDRVGRRSRARTAPRRRSQGGAGQAIGGGPVRSGLGIAHPDQDLVQLLDPARPGPRGHAAQGRHCRRDSEHALPCSPMFRHLDDLSNFLRFRLTRLPLAPPAPGPKQVAGRRIDQHPAAPGRCGRSASGSACPPGR